MKKLFVVMLAIILMTAFASAETIDFSSMSTDEIMDVISSARNELTVRSVKEDGKLFILDIDGIQVYLTGNSDVSGKYLEIEAVFINNTKENLSIHPDHCIVNGWQVYCDIIGETNAGMKKKDEFQIKMSDADISDISEIETIEFEFHAYNISTNKRKNLGKVLLTYDGQKFAKVE